MRVIVAGRPDHGSDRGQPGLVPPRLGAATPKSWEAHIYGRPAKGTGADQLPFRCLGNEPEQPATKCNRVQAWVKGPETELIADLNR